MRELIEANTWGWFPSREIIYKKQTNIKVFITILTITKICFNFGRQNYLMFVVDRR